MPFHLSGPDWDKITISVDDIVGNKGWDGKEFRRAERYGFEVMGSFVSSDNDTGIIKLSVCDGDEALIKTGPVNTNKFIWVVNETGGYFQFRLH